MEYGEWVLTSEKLPSYMLGLESKSCPSKHDAQRQDSRREERKNVVGLLADTKVEQSV